jgi:hypothetical protein
MRAKTAFLHPIFYYLRTPLKRGIMELVIIQKKIFEIRGHRVMLDFDLAELYHVETRALNQSVKRNKSRFPKDFMFRLSAKEWDSIRLQVNSSHSVMSSKKHRGSKYLPYAFTEHGVAFFCFEKQESR